MIEFRTVIGRFTGKEAKKLSEVKEMFGTMTTVQSIQVYTFTEMY